MGDLVALYVRSVELFGPRVRAIGDRWAAPTPDAEWDVRALVNHVLVENLWVPPLMAGKTIAEVGDRFDGDQLGDDPLSSWDSAAQAAMATIGEDGALERTVHVSFGDISGREYVSQLTCDHLIHGWDLARAIGADEALDPELVDFASEYLAPQVDGWRSAGAFGAAVDLPARRRPPVRAPRPHRAGSAQMSLPRIAGKEEWLAARTELLAKEKELTRRRDALNTERRNLPMVEVEKDYTFEGPSGTVRLIDLFEGRRQLIVYHFMFHPEWEDGCPSCTAGTDELSPGFLEHLHIRDTTYALVSRAPLEKLERWKAIKGWDLPWYSSAGTDFNYDFGVTIDESVAPGDFNYRTRAEYEAMGSDFFDYDQPFDMPGRSCFLEVDGRVFHTYSQYARGLESTGGSYYFLDLTALGRQEEWEEPKGRTDSARSGRPDFAS